MVELETQLAIELLAASMSLTGTGTTSSRQSMEDSMAAWPGPANRQS
jgi:hypothetical protein